MAHVLVINSSPVAQPNSFSSALLTAFLDEYVKKHPEDTITHVDLNVSAAGQETLTAPAFSAYFAPTNTQPYIRQLKATDKLIIVAPMTNFNYPATLKNWLDHVLVADQTFSYKYATSSGDAKGLVPHVKALVLATQGAPYGWYPWGNHVQMLEGTLKFMGMSVVPAILLAGTKVTYRNVRPADAIKDVADQIAATAATF